MKSVQKDKVEGRLYGKISIMALLDFARCDPRLTAQDVVYLQALGSRVRQDTIGLRTQMSIALEMNVSRTTVRKHEKRLIECQYISKSRRPERGLRNKYQYSFNIMLAQQDSSPDDLRAYGERIAMLCEVKSETPNGHKQRNPQKVSKYATSNGSTKKQSGKESEKEAHQGVGAVDSNFKPISEYADTLVSKFVNEGK